MEEEVERRRCRRRKMAKQVVTVLHEKKLEIKAVFKSSSLPNFYFIIIII